MTVIGAVISWTAIAGLLWLAAFCLIGTVVLAQPGYAVFAVLLAFCAFVLAARVIREGGR